VVVVITLVFPAAPGRPEVAPGSVEAIGVTVDNVVEITAVD